MVGREVVFNKKVLDRYGQDIFGLFDSIDIK